MLYITQMNLRVNQVNAGNIVSIRLCSIDAFLIGNPYEPLIGKHLRSLLYHCFGRTKNQHYLE